MFGQFRFSAASVCSKPAGSRAQARPALLRSPEPGMAGDGVRLAALAVGLASLLAIHPAKAALGAGVASVEADRQHFHASSQHNARGAFSVHELTMANGTVVREYASPTGAIFAVSWHGRVIPDLKQLLGAQFATFKSSPNRQRGGLGHLVVQDAAQNPNLVVESNGRVRSFHGRAYLINALPAKVSTNDIE